jgi:hypothetical protein
MNQGGVTILVGTTKGAFLISGGSGRQGWTVKGPFCDGNAERLERAIARSNGHARPS